MVQGYPPNRVIVFAVIDVRVVDSHEHNILLLSGFENLIDIENGGGVNGE